MTLERAARPPRSGTFTGAPAFARLAVSCVALLSGTLLAVRLGRYDFNGDELYFIAAGRRPAFGYADQGPLVPLLAAAADLLDPGSTVLLRLPAVLATVAAVVLSAVLAREFGGGSDAQVLAALAYAATPAAVLQSALLTTYALDATLTAMVSWLFIRWVRVRRDRLLVLAGAVAALDLQVKWLMPVTWMGLAAGVALFGPREMLRRPAWWLGTGLLVASAVPTLWWQRAHGWPQLTMGSVVRQEQLATSDGIIGMPWQIILVTGPLGALLLVGMWAGLRWEGLRPYRFLVPIVLAGLLAIVLAGLRPYFVVGALPGLFAAGTTYLAQRGLGRGLRGIGHALIASAVAITVVAVVALPLPQRRLTPTDAYAQIDWRTRLFGPSGWQELADGVEDAYRGIPPEQYAGLVLITQNYWQAAGLDVIGSDDLPPVYSPNRGYGYFPAPPDSATTVLYVGIDEPRSGLGADFADTTLLARIDRPLGFPGVDRGVSVWICRDPLEPWSAAWPTMRTLRMVSGTSR
ncbi:glycosyltransferase family 39 protein [Nocardia jejuensis]|uniref:glycosyltransferase family 39 protein n=1 Tax=Nocardia jejuensis TaxID=328049 RepID=UPI00083288C9|nr:glycosyltransferase family 39 protein [Nocardia jejuensis]